MKNIFKCFFRLFFYKDTRISPEIGTIFEFNFPFAIYIGGNGKGIFINKFPGGIVNGQNPNFNMEHYEGKFIRLSIFKGTWRVTNVYDGGYAGCYFVTVIREDISKDYKEWIPFLRLKKKDI